MAMPLKVQKLPVDVEAMHYDGDNITDIGEWLGAHGVKIKEHTYGSFTIPTLEGPHQVFAGWWVIRGVRGEFYPCRGDIFDASYRILS